MTIGAANSGFPPPVDRVVRPRQNDDDLLNDTASEGASDQDSLSEAPPKEPPPPGPYSPPPAPGSLLNIKI